MAMRRSFGRALAVCTRSLTATLSDIVGTAVPSAFDANRRIAVRRAGDSAIDEAGRPPGDGQCAQEVRVERERRMMLPAGERAQRPHQEQILLPLPPMILHR